MKPYSKNSSTDRIIKFVKAFEGKECTRKDHLAYYQGLSPLYASQDFAKGVELKRIETGEKRFTKYKKNKSEDSP